MLWWIVKRGDKSSKRIWMDHGTSEWVRRRRDAGSSFLFRLVHLNIWKPCGLFTERERARERKKKRSQHYLRVFKRRDLRSPLKVSASGWMGWSVVFRQTLRTISSPTTLFLALDNKRKKKSLKNIHFATKTTSSEVHKQSPCDTFSPWEKDRVAARCGKG